MAQPMGEEAPTTIMITEGTESIELVAEQLERFCDAAEKLVSTGLTRRAIVILLHDRLPGVGMTTIRNVLNALPDLRGYLKDS